MWLCLRASPVVRFCINTEREIDRSGAHLSLNFHNIMFIPFISDYSHANLSRRKAGGGGGRGKAGKPSGKAASSSGIDLGGGTTAKPYGPGGGKPYPYPSNPTNPLLAGRATGGGARQDIYGSR